MPKNTLDLKVDGTLSLKLRIAYTSFFCKRVALRPPYSWSEQNGRDLTEKKKTRERNNKRAVHLHNLIYKFNYELIMKG